MNKNIQTFNNWALNDKDIIMQKNHTKSVNQMINIIKNNFDILNKPFNFLDIGCGNGWVVRQFSKMNYCNYSEGIDGSTNMIKKAQTKSSDKFK